MNRLVLKIAGPAIIFGFLLSAICLAAAFQINRLQRGMARLLPVNVAAVEAAQKLEILQRELRFLLLRRRLNPTPAVDQRIAEAHREFETTLDQARAAATDDQQRNLVDRVDRAFRANLAEGPHAPFDDVEQVRRWVESHPVFEADRACQELLEVNNREMRETVADSDALSHRVQAALLLFCVLGLLGGFLGGFGTARRMHQSITRMLVLVRDVHAQLDEEVGLLEVDATASLATLDERLASFVERVREVTGQVQRQQQEILRGEQLAAVGQLAAAVAHEIRNPVTGIKLLVERAQRRSDRSGMTADDLAIIHRELVRLERTTQGLLDFARPPALHARTDDVAPALRQAVELVAARANQLGIELRLDLPAEPVTAWHDRDQIAAVVRNLLVNALEAVRHSGTVTVAARALPEGVAQVSVRDTGPGLPGHLLPRLFTPFSSTKSTGTGLGLSLSRRIARQHGGDLTAANHPDGGACFLLTLPQHGPESHHA